MPLRRQILFFLVVAALQAVGNYGTYLLLLQITDWPIAFLAAAAVGIAVQTALQIKSTFRSKLKLDISVRYVIYQIGYMAVFAILLGATIRAGVPAAVAPIPVLVIVTPLHFLLSRMIITGRGTAS
jgi:putative flippase GtrA